MFLISIIWEMMNIAYPIEPVFKFKYYKNKYFMKGLGSLTTSSEWIELKKIR